MTLNKIRPYYLENLDSLGTMGSEKVDIHYHNSQLIDANMVWHFSVNDIMFGLVWMHVVYDRSHQL